MSHSYSSSRRRESELFPGVTFVLRRMSEGRRLELRKKLGPTNAKIREILREQGKLLELPADKQDADAIMLLQDSYDGIQIETMNPETVLWGCKAIEGLEVDGKTLTLDDWPEWPSALFNEVLQAINDESQLNGADEIKNLPLASTSGKPEVQKAESMTATTAGKKDVM